MIFWRLYFYMVKCLSFHNSSFALRILFNVNGKATMRHTPCFLRERPIGRYYGAQKGYMYSIMTLRNDPFRICICCRPFHSLHGHKSGFIPNSYTTWRSTIHLVSFFYLNDNRFAIILYWENLKLTTNLGGILCVSQGGYLITNPYA
jgi:hypothetical protein